jgi:acyl-coenzyme A synthetase/AMP-(fatty) acid ligase
MTGPTVLSRIVLGPRLVEYELRSSALGRRSGLRVLLPAGYADGTAFPVLYLLHGGGDDFRSWTDKGGATEATVWSNFYPVTHIDPTWASIPYGRPIQNARYYVLDSYFNPLPIGSRGDLYIGGECLTAGYFGRPDLTAERYVSDPHANTLHGKMYKTGDLARYRSDGNLEFLGRNDFQVKIRGFRIELGEIEAQLAESPDVRESVVIAHKEASGEKRLLAYVVPADEAVNPAELAAALRTYMAARLPDYMVPAAFVRIPSLPLTPNGKLDRDRLPAPDGEAYAQPAYEAPQGRLEIIIAQVWQELLNLERIGRNDNFFELGGHSLLAMRVVEHLRQGLSRLMSDRCLFRPSYVILP